MEIVKIFVFFCRVLFVRWENWWFCAPRDWPNFFLSLVFFWYGFRMVKQGSVVHLFIQKNIYNWWNLLGSETSWLIAGRKGFFFCFLGIWKNRRPFYGVWWGRRLSKILLSPWADLALDGCWRYAWCVRYGPGFIKDIVFFSFFFRSDGWQSTQLIVGVRSEN